MKPKIHPKYYPEARVVCACGNTYSIGATKPEITTEVCAKCHPFFTGEQRIVDTAGQVERFMRRLVAGEQQRVTEQTVKEQRKEEEREAKRARRGLTPLSARKAPAKSTKKATAEPAASEDTAEPGEGEA
jgi:large subunit ribosomal protein L31